MQKTFKLSITLTLIIVHELETHSRCKKQVTYSIIAFILNSIIERLNVLFKKKFFPFIQFMFCAEELFTKF